MNSRRLLLALLILSLALVSPGCDDTDPVASSGSTIQVFANPKNIPESRAGLDPSTITALVLTSSGISQVGVEVKFTTEDGCFASVGETCDIGGVGNPIETERTNEEGIASVDLFTAVSTTVEARSGNAVGTETVTVGGLQLVGTVELRSLTTLPVARDTDVDFRATVKDSQGLVLPEVQVSLEIDPFLNATPSFINGILTDQNGELEFTVEVLGRFDIQAKVTTGSRTRFSNTITVLLTEP